MNTRQPLPVRTKRICAWTICILLSASTIRAHGQSQPPAFEVASIRKAATGHTLDELSRGIGLFSISPLPANKLTVRNANLSLLICMAYDVSTDQVSGGPDWLGTDAFDVIAKVDGDTALSLDQMRPLLRHLLEERFHLQVHRTSKEVSGYALVIASGGPKLKLAAAPGEPRAQIVPGGLQAWNATIGTLAAMLNRPAGRPVVDKTGLQGIYDFKLDYAPPEDSQSSLPSVFVALEEQLGLKLTAQKVPREMLVVDRADRNPAEN